MTYNSCIFMFFFLMIIKSISFSFFHFIYIKSQKQKVDSQQWCNWTENGWQYKEWFSCVQRFYIAQYALLMLLFLYVIFVNLMKRTQQGNIRRKIVAEIEFFDHPSLRRSLKIHYHSHGSNTFDLLTHLFFSFIISFR